MSMDVRTGLGQARDQGQRPTCVAFAATAAHEARRFRAHEDAAPLSEEFICWAVADEFGRIPPLSFRDTGAVMSDRGQPTAIEWPYRPDGAPVSDPPADVVASAATRRARVTTITSGLRGVRAAVEGGAVVVAIVRLWDEFFEGDGATLTAPDRDELLADDVLHAVALLPGGDGYTIRNSWGTNWRDDGHVHVSSEVVRTVMVAAFVVDIIEPTQQATSAVRPGSS